MEIGSKGVQVSFIGWVIFYVLAKKILAMA